MTAIEEARTVTAKLSPEERRSLFEWLATEPMGLAPGIYSPPGVGGGDACVGGTRIAVWVLESYRRGGMSNPDLLAAYPDADSTGSRLRLGLRWLEPRGNGPTHPRE